MTSVVGFLITPFGAAHTPHKAVSSCKFLCHVNPAVEAPGFSRVTYFGNEQRALAPVTMNHRAEARFKLESITPG